MDVVDHLPNEGAAVDLFRRLAAAAREFLFIRHSSFEDVEYLGSLGLKISWTDWSGHRNMMTLADYRRVFAELGWTDYVIVPNMQLVDSSALPIVPLDAPPNTGSYDAAVHGPKALIRFDHAVYGKFDIFVRLDPVLDDAQWHQITTVRGWEASRVPAEAGTGVGSEGRVSFMESGAEGVGAPQSSTRGAASVRKPTPETWTLPRGWNHHRLYGPLAHAIHSVMAVSVVAERSRETARGNGALVPVRLLQVGGEPGVLSAMFAQDGGAAHHGQRVEYDIVSVVSLADRHVRFAEMAFDCAVAVDWLQMIAPSQREQAVTDLCRLARHGVVLVNPFDAPEVVAAARTVNELHRATHGDDHPQLGRQLEIGLPDIDTVQRWVARFFPCIDTRSYEHIALWRVAESLAVIDERLDAGLRSVGEDAAALYQLVNPMERAEPGYQTMLVATARAGLADETVPASMAPAQPEFAALIMRHALEAAAHRRALDRLVEAVTVKGEREREEFRATLASLAEELRELDARAEFLAREVRNRDHTIMNQQATIAQAERSAADLGEQLRQLVAHLQTLESERDALRAETVTVQHSRSWRLTAPLRSLRARWPRSHT